MTKKPKMILANWKMNLPEQGIENYYSYLEGQLPQEELKSLIIAPPATHLSLCHAVNKKVKLAAQDISSFASGAHTGQISASLALLAGASFTLIGHYECLEFYGPNYKQVIKSKVEQALANKLQPVVCFGEGSESDDPVDAFKNALQDKEVYYAYEPYWAIGKAGVSTDLIIKKVQRVLDHKEKAGITDKMFYGGSINPQNAHLFKDLNGLDGLLVGSASLRAYQLTHIIKSLC